MDMQKATYSPHLIVFPAFYFHSYSLTKHIFDQTANIDVYVLPQYVPNNQVFKYWIVCPLILEYFAVTRN